MNKYTDRSRPQTAYSVAKRSHASLAEPLSTRCATASSLIRPKLLIGNLISTIDKPSVTNRHNLLHENLSGNFDEIDHANPDDSQYEMDLYFPQKPPRSSISGLTLIENEKLAKKSFSISYAPNSTREETLKADLSHKKLPTNQDFTKMLNRLEMVISNKSLGNRRIELTEGEAVDDYLEIADGHYYRVITKGKKCPMRVMLKVLKGKVITYVSRTTIMPNEATHDQVSKSYTFEVSDPGLKFKAETISLGIFAIADSNYSIRIHFGREKEHHSSHNKSEPRENRDYYQNDVAREMEKDLTKYRAKYTQKRNLKLVTELSEKSLTWEIRHQQTVERKKQILLEKKKRAEMMIIRNEIKREEERKKREFEEAKTVLQAQQRVWIILIKFAQAYEIMNERRCNEKSKTLMKLKENGSARKLQLFYKKKQSDMTAYDVNLLRAGPLLKLYCSSIKMIMEKTVKKKILSLIRMSARMREIPTHFEDYYSCAEKIQKAWAEYVKKKNERWSSLIELWNQTIPTYISPRPKPKSGKGKSRSPSKIMPNIPDFQRDRILTEYIRECKRKYINDLNTFYESKGHLLNTAAGALQGSQENPKKIKIEYPPNFVFNPTSADIMKLIEKFIKSQTN
ncbi:unnamed protein product [Blepharisma stoltei]|uniref:Uncharacterized protein n=1 Tax=Blepharisma stoltei TaxID=1481888 RepID=A0AAU9K473_9CILI|nr:unnamed protein product [Blepharisma stoltei]